jgi:hypothetical protein
MASNRNFNNAIQLSTSSVGNVKLRFDLMRQIAEGVPKDHKIQERCFTRELEQELFDRNPTCQLRKQAIQELDDAAVDHIEPYWRGGRPYPRMPDLRTDIVMTHDLGVTRFLLPLKTQTVIDCAISACMAAYKSTSKPSVSMLTIRAYRIRSLNRLCCGRSRHQPLTG